MKSKHSLVNAGLIGIVFFLVCFIIGKLLSAPSQDISGEETDSPASGRNIVELTRKQSTASNTDISQADNQITVIENAVICLGIQDQKPVGIVSQISSNAGKIYCWARVINGKGQKIRYIWYFGGKPSFSLWQIITAQRFRTWCGYRIDPGASGKCYVEIVSQTGRVLVRVDFRIIAQPSRSRIKHL